MDRVIELDTPLAGLDRDALLLLSLVREDAQRELERLDSTRHLPGKHNQKDHGHGHAAGGRVQGRDLTDELDYDGLIKEQNKAARDYDNESGDVMLGGILKLQGFDGKPAVASKAEMDKLVADGHQELFRGIVGLKEGRQPRRFGPKKTAAEYHEEFRSGELHPGLGFYGNGTYTSPDRLSAVEYSDRTPGSLARMALNPSAKVVNYNDVYEELARINNSSSRGEVLIDPGRYAAAKGIDAIRISGPDGGGFSEVLVLNRTALTVQEGE